MLAKKGRRETYLQLNRQHIRQPLDTRLSPRLLRRITSITPILALIKLDILLIQALLQRHRPLAPQQLLPSLFLRQILQRQTQVQKALYLVRHSLTILARCLRLQFTIKSLVDDAVTAVLTPNLWFLPVTVPLVQLLGQELEKLVRVLLLGRDEIFKGFPLRDPESTEDIGRRIAIGVFHGVKVLKHVIHGAGKAVGGVAARVAVAQVVVSEDGVVKERLENDVLVAGGTCVVDASETVGFAGCCRGVLGDVGGAIFDRIGREELVLLAFPCCNKDKD